MKRIEFAFPIDAIRGTLGSKQDLRYAEHDNKAFESPAGKVNYARNYEPRLIGAKVARTGLKYFAVKTKSAFKATAKALKQCAVMGAMSAIYGITLTKSAIMAQLQAQYALAKDAKEVGTFHKWVCAGIRASLLANAATITVVGPTATVNLGNNPWTNASTAIAVTSAMLVKFWKELCSNGIKFTVDGADGIVNLGDSFSTIIANNRMNVLGLSTQTVGSTSYVKEGAKWLKDVDGNYVEDDVEPADGEAYILVDDAPSA